MKHLHSGSFWRHVPLLRKHHSKFFSNSAAKSKSFCNWLQKAVVSLYLLHTPQSSVFGLASFSLKASPA